MRAIVVAVGLAGSLLASTASAQSINPLQGPSAPGNTADDPDGEPPSQEKAIESGIPLTPGMIRKLVERLQRNQATAETTATPQQAAPDNREINVSFTPGSTTPIITTVKGYPTAVSFFDATGQPWPVQWDTNSAPAAGISGSACQIGNSSGGGNPATATSGFFVCSPTKGSNTLEITPLSPAPRGGLVVELEGAPKPLTFLMISGDARYDSNLSVHVGARGPNAKIEILTRPDAPDTGAPYLTGMLQGVPPADAVPLSVEGVSPDALRAWRLGRNIYLRTRDTLLSPQWTASEEEAGLTVYAVPATPRVLLSEDGRTVSAELGGE